MNDEESILKKIEALNEKNKGKDYSLGDCLLLDMYEKKLIELGYTKEQVKTLTPSYYKT
jgi:hypothetical protein